MKGMRRKHVERRKASLWPRYVHAKVNYGVQSRPAPGQVDRLASIGTAEARFWLDCPPCVGPWHLRHTNVRCRPTLRLRLQKSSHSLSPANHHHKQIHSPHHLIQKHKSSSQWLLSTVSMPKSMDKLLPALAQAIAQCLAALAP